MPTTTKKEKKKKRKKEKKKKKIDPININSIAKMRLNATAYRRPISRYQQHPKHNLKQRILALIALLVVICIVIWMYAVTTILKANQMLMADKQQIAHNHGDTHALPNKISPAQVTQQSRKSSITGDRCPQYPLMTSDHVYHLIELWFEANCPINVQKAESCRFVTLGQYLLNHAIRHGLTLLTVEIGAMDGKTSDPIHETFVAQGRWALRKKDRFHTLENWLPIIIEPVPENYENLLKTYHQIQEKTNLPCSIPINTAISYDKSTSKSCKFCRYNVSPSAPPECSKAPIWQQERLGTLDCDFFKKNLGAHFHECIIQDPLPCASLKETMTKGKASYLPHDATVGMLHISVEAYEHILVKGLIKEMNPPPMVIHFENGSMNNQDIKIPLPGGKKRFDITIQTLEKAGYRIYHEHNDYTLAIHLPYVVKQNVVDIDESIKENNLSGQDPFYHILKATI
jgi:hypothetical protein